VILCRAAIVERLADPPSETWLSEAATHARRCARCADLLPFVEPLGDVIELDPGPTFTAAVVRATTGTRRRRLVRRLARWRDAWPRLCLRPRFGLELASVGALSVWLVLGVSGLSIAEPARWLAEQPTGTWRSVGGGTEAAGELAAALVRLPGRVFERPAPEPRDAPASGERE
jgi:hypothetical protein